MFTILNKNLGIDTIDLHYLLKDSALEMLQEWFEDLCRERYWGSFRIITGWGKHSSKWAVLLPEVKNYL